MTRTFPIALLLAAVSVLNPSGALAQETITLDEAIARAQQQSGRLAEISARQAGAAAAESGRSAARMPVVSLLAGYTRTNHVEEFKVFAPGQPTNVIYPDIPDNFRSRIDLQWPIYTGGRSEALVRAASAESSAVGQDLEAARADLRLEVTRAFWALTTARETERVIGVSLTNYDSHVADLRARLDQGLIPPNDVTFAEAQRSHQRMLAIEAANTRAIAEADLRRLVGGARSDRPSRRSGECRVAHAGPGGFSWCTSIWYGASCPRLQARRLACPRRRRSRDDEAADLDRRRLRFRAAEPADLPARRHLGRLVGCNRQRRRGRSGTAVAAMPSRPRRLRRHAPSRRASPTSTSRSRSSSSNAGWNSNPRVPRSRLRAMAFAVPLKPGVSLLNVTAPVS